MNAPVKVCEEADSECDNARCKDYTLFRLFTNVCNGGFDE